MTYLYFYICCAALVLNASLFIAAYRRRHKSCAKEYMTLVALLFVALLFFSLSLLGQDITHKYILHEMKFIGTAFFPVAVYNLFMRFMGRDALVKRRYIIILSVVPVFTVVAALTNGAHNLFRQTVWLAERPFGSFVMPLSGILFWVLVAYSYAVFLFILVMFIYNMQHTPEIYRDRMRIMIWSVLITMIVNILSVTSLLYVDYGDVTLLMFTLTLAVQYYALLVYKPRRMILLSRSRAVGEIKNPIILYDYEDKFMDANITAYKELRNVSAMDIKEFMNVTEKTFYGRIYSLSIEKMYDEENFFAGTVVLLNDVTKIKKQEETLKKIAGHDYMTGLDNLHTFRAALDAFTGNDLPIAVIIFDIWAMREINSTFGVIYGDELIQDAANLIKKRLPEDALCARLDSDEFGIALPNTTKSAADIFIEKVLKDFKEMDINVDCGFAAVDRAPFDIWQLFKAAEDDLAKNKMGFKPNRK